MNILDPAERLVEVCRVLLENYHNQGAINLLHATLNLTRALLSAHKVICTSSLSSQIKLLLADALLSQHRLSHDIEALKNSIEYYRDVCTDDLLPMPLRCWTEIGLAFALNRRFLALNREEDCKESVQRLDATVGCVMFEAPVLKAHAIITAGLVRGSQTTITVMPATSEEITALLNLLRMITLNTLPRSYRINASIAEARLCCALTYLTQRSEYVWDGLQAANRALRLCSESTEVLRYDASLELFNLHYTSAHKHWSIDSTQLHLEASLEIATKMRSSSLSARNAFIHCNSEYLWGRALLEIAVRDENLDSMEQAVDIARKTAIDGPRTHAYRQGWIGHYAYALGLYFDQSGCVSALDEIIALRLHVPELIVQTDFIACNLAEAMSLRAQISDRPVARELIHSAVEICLARKAAPNFVKASPREKSGLNLELITASQMQLEAGDTPFLAIQTIIDLARAGLQTHDEPSNRICLVLAQISALSYLARKNVDVSLISEAELVLEHEMSKDFMTSSIYHLDLMAARADLTVLWSDMSNEDARLSLHQKAWEIYYHSVFIHTTAGRARERYKICRRWASNARDRGDYESAFRAYSCAIEFLPRVVLLAENVIGRIEALRQVSGLAASSIATALRLGNIVSALHFLEQSRSILLLQSFQNRWAQIQGLPIELQEKFTRVSGMLERADELPWTIRRHAAEELSQIISRIRASPTFERFLLPPSMDDIQSTLRCHGSYAVVIIPSDDHCDVIALGVSGGPSHLRLTTLNLDGIRNMSCEFTAACATARAAESERTLRGLKIINSNTDSNNHDGNAILSELWFKLTFPILSHMGLLEKRATDHRKRLWWCPVGLLSSLPVHAAGMMKETSCEYVSTYVVSSYTPTLSLLHRMLTESPGQSAEVQGPSKLLLVSHSEASGLSPLPNAKLEIDSIKKLVQTDSLIKTPEPLNGSVEDILANLAKANILHLACHGHQDQSNPLDSGFELRNGRLTLGKLMRANTTQAQLAYLSACESAGTDQSRPDEGLNLAGTMIFLGFRSVIATMWAMDDVDGPFMAEHIYRRIIRGTKLDLQEIPYAVDDAVQKLRETGAPPSRWATYVHYGV